MIRPAVIEDVAVIQAMIRELAAHEDESDTVVTDEAELHDVLFGPDSVVSAFVAVDDGSGQVIGYTVWCLIYCTWRGNGAQVDDVYVRPAAAGQGLEKALLGEVARVCLERGYRHMQWWGLLAHKEGTAFYQSVGAGYDSDLMIFRISGEPLAALAEETGGAQ